MSNQAVAIKIKTRSGERYFNGWGNGARVQTSWSLAGAKLFLACTTDNLDLVTNQLKAKKKKFTIVDVGDIDAHLEASRQKDVEISRLQRENWQLQSQSRMLGTTRCENLHCSDEKKRLVWMTRDEFRHLTIWERIKPVNLDYLAMFAIAHRDQSKKIMEDSFDEGDDATGHFFREDAIEFVQLARALNREIRKQGGL